VHWIQLRWTTLLQRQWYSLVNIPVPDLTEQFTQIELEIALRGRFQQCSRCTSAWLNLRRPPLCQVPHRPPASPRQLVSHPLLCRLVPGPTPLFVTRSKLFCCEKYLALLGRDGLRPFPRNSNSVSGFPQLPHRHPQKSPSPSSAFPSMLKACAILAAGGPAITIPSPRKKGKATRTPCVVYGASTPQAPEARCASFPPPNMIIPPVPQVAALTNCVTFAHHPASNVTPWWCPRFQMNY
jgi:hypothetical protein